MIRSRDPRASSDVICRLLFLLALALALALALVVALLAARGGAARAQPAPDPPPTGAPAWERWFAALNAGDRPAVVALMRTEPDAAGAARRCAGGCPGMDALEAGVAALVADGYRGVIDPASVLLADASSAPPLSAADASHARSRPSPTRCRHPRAGARWRSPATPSAARRFPASSRSTGAAPRAARSSASAPGRTASRSGRSSSASS